MMILANRVFSLFCSRKNHVTSSIQFQAKHSQTKLVVWTLTFIDTSSTTELPFDRTILGPKGFEAIILLLPRMPQLTSLCLRDTQMYSLDWCDPYARNNAIAFLVECVVRRDLPNLTSLDLSENALRHRRRSLASCYGGRPREHHGIDC